MSKTLKKTTKKAVKPFKKSIKVVVNHKKTTVKKALKASKKTAVKPKKGKTKKTAVKPKKTITKKIVKTSKKDKPVKSKVKKSKLKKSSTKKSITKKSDTSLKKTEKKNKIEIESRPTPTSVNSLEKELVLILSKNKEGILQTKIYEEVGAAKKNRTITLLAKMAKENVIKRERSGRSFLVFLV